MADRTWRELSKLAELYDLEYLGLTRRGHHKWRHRPSGRQIVTVSNTTSWHSLKNTERDIKEIIRRTDGQYAGTN